MLVGVKNGTATLENIMAVSKDLGIYYLGICPRESKVYVHTKIYTEMFIAALFTIAKSGNNPNVHHMING